MSPTRPADDNPANPLYLGVVSAGLVSTARAGLKPRRLAYAMFVIALAQMSVPVFVLMVLNSDLSHLQHITSPGLIAPTVAGVVGLNACIAGIFVGSAVLFLRACASDLKQN